MMPVELAAIGAAALMLAVAAFQVALAAGLPLGEATMGGRAATTGGVLATRYRAVAAGSAVILILASWIVLARAALVSGFIGGQALALGTWLVAGFLALNTVTNLTGRHPLERWGLASVALIAAVLVGFVAYTAP